MNFSGGFCFELRGVLDNFSWTIRNAFTISARRGVFGGRCGATAAGLRFFVKNMLLKNVKIFVPFISLVSLIYRKQVIATNEFEKMREDCASIVYRFLLSMCGNEDLAKELTSETFYQAYLHIDKFRGECKPETWLCQIAKNALYKETRRAKRIVPWEQFRTAKADGEDVLEKLSDKEQALKIHRHLHRLSEPYKEVFMLRVLGELRFQEIAGLFGKSESWAKVTFYRAKNKLIELMEVENGH